MTMAAIKIQNDEKRFFDKELRKQREISFCCIHKTKPQVMLEIKDAISVLNKVEGIISLSIKSPNKLLINYSIECLNLKLIESALIELGFHLNNSLRIKLRRALYHYSESVEQENLGINLEATDSTQRLFINRYQNMQHGCRDSKPLHWRKYL